MSRIIWQGIGAEIRKGTEKGKCEAAGQTPGRAGVLEGPRTRHLPYCGCTKEAQDKQED